MTAYEIEMDADAPSDKQHASQAALVGNLKREQWSDDDLDRLAEFALSMKGHKLDAEQLGEMRESNWNHGMYLAALLSQHMVKEIVKSYHQSVYERIHKKAEAGWKAIYKGSRAPSLVRSWLFNMISAPSLVVPDFDDPSQLWTVNPSVLAKIQVHIVAFDAGAIEITFMNVTDPVQKTRMSVVQLEGDMLVDQEAAVIADMTVDFAHKVMVFQQRDRLARYA
jgi:hypothetical protein